MLMFAARNGNPQAIKVLLEAGADVNARETIRGTTALMWAVEQKHPEAVKVLLAGGADPSAKSGGAGLPRNYMANRVNLRAVEHRAGSPQARGGRGHHLRRAARRSIRRQAVEVGGQRGLAQALGAGWSVRCPAGPAGWRRRTGSGGTSRQRRHRRQPPAAHATSGSGTDR